MWKTLCCLTLLVSLPARPVRAHHIFEAQHDTRHPVRLTGTVTSMEWINPHSWIHLQVTDSKGSVTKWMIECGSPGFLRRSGLSEKSLTTGTQISVEGYLSKDALDRADGTAVTLKDGRRLPLSGFVVKDGKSIQFAPSK